MKSQYFILWAVFVCAILYCIIIFTVRIYTGKKQCEKFDTKSQPVRAFIYLSKQFIVIAAVIIVLQTIFADPEYRAERENEIQSKVDAAYEDGYNNAEQAFTDNLSWHCDESYDKGYSDGQSDYEPSAEDSYNNGYEEGYMDGIAGKESIIELPLNP